jgi:hypothetical protein
LVFNYSGRGMSYARLTNTYFMPGGCFCAHRCCLESVMHARNRVSCVPSELGSTTVMVNYKCKLQHCSSRRKLKLCQGASCHCCTVNEAEPSGLCVKDSI